MIIFFSVDGDIESARNKVFHALGIAQSVVGDSANAMGGIYVSASVFGVALRLEENAYDYEDQFGFMLTVKEDAVVGLVTPDEVIEATAKAVSIMLARNLGTPVAIECDSGLKFIE